MSSVTITVDTSQIKDLGTQFKRAARIGFDQVLFKAEALVRIEAPLNNDPGARAGGLANSIGHEIEIKGDSLIGLITANPLSDALPARDATIEYSDGREDKKIRLRPTKAFMYAKVVAEGRKALVAGKDTKAKRLLVPLSAVSFTPKAVIVDRGRKFVAVRSVGATKPNDYPGRAFKALQPMVEPTLIAALLKGLGAQ